MSDYSPVSCDIHSLYEAAILQRRKLHLRWHPLDGDVRDEVVQPLDVTTRAGEEFLLLRDAAHHDHSVRLDRIVTAETLD